VTDKASAGVQGPEGSGNSDEGVESAGGAGVERNAGRDPGGRSEAAVSAPCLTQQL